MFVSVLIRLGTNRDQILWKFNLGANPIGGEVFTGTTGYAMCIPKMSCRVNQLFLLIHPARAR